MINEEGEDDEKEKSNRYEKEDKIIINDTETGKVNVVSTKNR